MFYVILSLSLGVTTFELIKCYSGFKLDLIIIGCFIMATMACVVEIIPDWFRENFWYCNYCGSFRWLTSKHETINNDTITHKLCEKCHNEIHTLDYYD